MAGTKAGIGARFGSNKGSLLSQHGVTDPTNKVQDAVHESVQKADSTPEVLQTDTQSNTVTTQVQEERMQEVKSDTVEPVECVKPATDAQRYEMLKQESMDAQMVQISESVTDSDIPVTERVLQEKVQRAEQQAVQEARSIVGYSAPMNEPAYIQGSPVSADTYRAQQDNQIADIAAAIANETDPAVIQALLREKMDSMTRENSTRMATCLPKSREDCLRCPCNASCKRSLARYNVVTTSIRLPEDLKTALDIMINEDIRYANITMSSVVTLALQAVVEPYIDAARQRLSERNTRMEELRRKGIYVKHDKY